MTSSIGRRVREVRSWRRMSLRVTAELAGMSEGHLSRIERGERPVDRRSTLEALAAALRVAPSELAEQAFPPGGQGGETTVAATVVELDYVLSTVTLGEPSDRPARHWESVAADLAHLNEVLHPGGDYTAQATVLPRVIADLHTLYVTDGAPRPQVLAGLVECYHLAMMFTKHLGFRGLPSLAAHHASDAARELGDPAYLGLAAWVRALSLGGSGRDRMRQWSMRGVEELERDMDDPRARQVTGALHLNAALASAAMKDEAGAADHLVEATMHADAMGDQGRGFANLYFGPSNVGIWRMAVAVELGEAGRAAEIAATVNPAGVPSRVRQGMYWADLGRGLATQKATRGEAVAALAKAEAIAPERIRTNPFVRETIGDLTRRAQRDAVDRELRGLAYRCGIGVSTPTG